MEEEVEGGVSWIVIVAVVAVVVAAAAFFAGRALAGGGGPETLSEAVAQAQAGDLPCGDVPGGADTRCGRRDPAAGGAPPTGAGGAGGASFALRAICSQGDGQQAGGRARAACPAAASAVAAGSASRSSRSTATSSR